MAGGGRIGPVDRFQRRWPVLGVPIAVVYKYVDDQATYLAVIVTYYALFAIFPLLLLATSILGLLLQGDPELQAAGARLGPQPVPGPRGPVPPTRGTDRVEDRGRHRRRLRGLRRHGPGTAVQNATNIAWAIPRNSRLNPILLRVRGLLIVAFGGLAVLGLTTASVLVSNTTLITWLEGSQLRWLARVASVLVTGVCCTCSCGWRRPAPTGSAPPCPARC